jgi:hypothetical protein
MKHFSLWINVSILISIFGLIVCAGLLLELYRHDPYSWLKPPFEAIESRDLWNERKDLYLKVASFFLTSTVVSFILLLFNIFIKKQR